MVGVRTGAEVAARPIRKRVGWEARPLVRGGLQGCGDAIAFDRIYGAIAEPGTLSEHFPDRYADFFLPISST